MFKFQFNWENERKKVAAFRKGHELWIHVDGETHLIDLRPKAKSSKGKGLDISGETLAPMPGRILKTNFKTGELVKAGDTLVIMEAMKMEYTLKSSVAGTVKNVMCKVGDQVELNQMLVIVELEKKNGATDGAE